VNFFFEENSLGILKELNAQNWGGPNQNLGF
jgi:hypothetical protein